MDPEHKGGKEAQQGEDLTNEKSGTGVDPEPATKQGMSTGTLVALLTETARAGAAPRQVEGGTGADDINNKLRIDIETIENIIETIETLKKTPRTIETIENQEIE